MHEADKRDMVPTPVEERRANPRLTFDEQASVLIVGHGMSFSGRILDLSLEGCRIQALTNLPGGGRVPVEVTFSVNGLPFRMGGIIRWSSGYDLGIQFVRVSPARHLEWARVIEALRDSGAQEVIGATTAASRATPPTPLPQRDAELIQIVDVNLNEAARRAGGWIACRIGCTQCCHGAFAINALDVLRFRSGMEVLRSVNPAIAAAVEDRARAWIAEYGPVFPGDHATGRLGTSEKDRARFEDFASDAPCPALDPASGRCDVYEWRPMTCRVFGPPVRAAGDGGNEGLGHCELCFVGATPQQIAACEMPVPFELEEKLLDEIGSGSETVVAFALRESSRASQR